MQDAHGFERPSLVVEHSGGGTRYVLPRRQLAGVRHLGWILCCFGGFIILFMIGWMWMPISGGIEELQQDEGFGWLSIGFGCLGIFGLIPGLGILMSGVAVALNRTSCVVELRSGVLRTRERFLLASWRRKQKAESVKRLRVSLASEWKGSKEGQDVSGWLGDSEAALVAETSAGREFLVAVVYPRDLLLQLAADLAARLEVETMATTEVIDRDPLHMTEERPAAKKVEVIEGPPADVKILVPPQPADSTATIERRPYGITIDIPPVGIWKGSRGLMFFALVWNGFVGVFVTVMALSLAGVIEMEGDDPGWVGMLFMIPFVGVGVGTAFGAINMGRRHATIATADNLVMIVRHTIFGKTTKEWSAEQIDEIRMGNSGMEVNDVPIKELQIHARNSNKFGCLSQLDEDELAWIAGELNQALTISRPGSPDATAADYAERDQSGRVVPAPGSQISVDYAIDSTHIHVPAQGFRKNLTGLLFGLVFMSIAGGVVGFVVQQEFKNGIGGGGLFTFGFIAIWTLLFGGVGALAFFSCIIAARRRFEITVDRYQLTVVRRGLLGRRTFSWERDGLKPIEVKATGTKVNDRAYYQVFIPSQKANSLGIMSGHDRGDLAFVAGAINETLGLTKADTVPG